MSISGDISDRVRELGECDTLGVRVILRETTWQGKHPETSQVRDTETRKQY